jgi:hypothetical protein
MDKVREELFASKELLVVVPTFVDASYKEK